MPVPLSLIFVAVGAQSVAATPAAPPAPTRHWSRLFISPMGEPFRADRGGDALAMWFAQADRNHDGFLSVDEMQLDAERFFTQLDTNHDGEIDPDEMTHYESVIAPEISSGPRFEMAGMGAAGRQRGDGGAGGGGHRGGGHHRESSGGGGGFGSRGGDETHQGAARFGLLDLPEPVASADADFNRGVSLAEFRQAAVHRFAALDLDHQGRLTLAALELIRPAPEPQEHKPDSADSGSSVEPQP
jgi:hypothetical protein